MIAFWKTMIFGIKKIDNFDPYNIWLAIATNIPVLLMTAFVVQAGSRMSRQKLIFKNKPLLE